MIVFSLVVLIAIAWVFFKYQAVDYPRLFWIALIFKVTMAIGLGLVYRYYYTANDTWLFFEDATKLADLARENFRAYIQFLWNSDSIPTTWNKLTNTQERSLFLIKFISVFSLLTDNNYWISAVYFAFISFTASWYLFSIVTKHVQQSKDPAALAFLFFPSVVFWGSGLVKETLALAGIYLLSTCFIKLLKSQKVMPWEWLVMLPSFYIAWNLKYYWTALFMAVVTTSLLYFLLRRKFGFLSRYWLSLWVGIFLILISVASVMHPNFYPNRFLDVLITNHNDFVRISKPEGLIHYYQLTADWWSVGINAPWALISGLFRPVVWEASGAAAIAAAIENLFLLVLFFSSLFRKKDTTSLQLLFYSTIVYVALLCIFLALSTPNLGTLSRYRIGFLPFLVFVVSYRNPLLQYLRNRINLVRL